MQRLQKYFQLNALIIAVGYVVFGMLWILFSDKGLQLIAKDVQLFSKLSSTKGIVFVLTSGLLLYFVIGYSNRYAHSVREKVDQSLQSVKIATWSINLKNWENFTSKHHFKLFGLDSHPQNWSADDFYNLVHPEDRDRVKKAFNKSITQHNPYQVSYRIIWPDGTVRWLESKGTVECNEAGEAIRIEGIIADITEQKELEQQFAHEQELFERVFEQLPVMVEIYHPDTKEVRANRACTEIMGWTNEEMNNINMLKTYYPDTEIHKQVLANINRADGKWREMEAFTKEGEKRIQKWTNIRLSDNTIIGIGLDITEQRSLEHELEKERLELQKIYDNVPVYLFVYDEQNLVKRSNAYFKELIGAQAEGKQQLTNTSIFEQLIYEEKDLERAIQFFEGGYKNWQDFTFQDEHGEILSTSWMKVKISDHRSFAIGIDTTELRKNEQELKAVNERFKRAERIGQIGHVERDLKTGEMVWSDNIYNMIGYKKEEIKPSVEAILNFLHPEDKERYARVRKEANETGKIDDVFRFITSSSEVMYLHLITEIQFDESGTPVHSSSIVSDITQIKKFEQSLQEQKKLFQATIEHLPVGIAVNKIDSRESVLINRSFSEICGWPESMLTDSDSFFKLLIPDEKYRERVRNMVNADIISGKPKRMQWNGIRIATQSGEKRVINIKTIPIFDQNLLISSIIDVTAQIKAEKQLAESEHNYRLLFQDNPQPMLIYNPEDLQIIEVNNAMVKQYGYNRKELYAMSLIDLQSDTEKDTAQQTINKNKTLPLSDAHESKHKTKSGRIIDVRVTGAAIKYYGQKRRLVLISDITKQKKAEEMVLASLVEGENKERARIAQELHDGLGQYLAAANMNLDAVKNSIEQLEQRRQEQFKKGLNLLKQAVVETGQISRNLMPRVVDDYGLALAIETLVSTYQDDHNANISYYQNIGDLELPQAIKLNLFRIAQEALSNAIKYAEATQINVQLIKDGLDLLLTIDDNGKGFDADSPEFSAGLGLRTIKTRTGALGGSFEFDSKINKGTFIHITVPISNLLNA